MSEPVTAATIRDWLSAGEPLVFLDAAHPDGWIHDRAAGGTVRLPPEKVAPSRSLLARGKVILYSSANQVPASIYARTLEQQGFSDAHVLEGGADAWASLGLTATSRTVYPSRW